jgi:iron complex outermembrane receptor protein
VDEVDATSPASLLPLTGVHAERAITAAVDAKWSAHGWDVNASLFTSEIRDPLTALPAPGEKLAIINGPGPRRAPGAEVLIGYGAGPLHALASWSYVKATEEDTPGLRQDVPLVPRQSAELGAILEEKKRGRLGLEIGYTGMQALAYDPYRQSTPGFLELSALAEVRFSGISVFVNAINLTDVRQTNYAPLLRPSPGPGGNPITDVWAPLAGRTFNLGVRAEL